VDTASEAKAQSASPAVAKVDPELSDEVLSHARHDLLAPRHQATRGGAGRRRKAKSS
jgi:hypothetical protein